jgi:hypothetical protein
VIAGLRLDTTPYDNYTGRWAPRWQTTDRPPRGFRGKTSRWALVPKAVGIKWRNENDE